MTGFFVWIYRLLFFFWLGHIRFPWRYSNTLLRLFLRKLMPSRAFLLCFANLRSLCSLGTCIFLKVFSLNKLSNLHVSTCFLSDCKSFCAQRESWKLFGIQGCRGRGLGSVYARDLWGKDGLGVWAFGFWAWLGWGGASMTVTVVEEGLDWVLGWAFGVQGSWGVGDFHDSDNPDTVLGSGISGGMPPPLSQEFRPHTLTWCFSLCIARVDDGKLDSVRVLLSPPPKTPTPCVALILTVVYHVFTMQSWLNCIQVSYWMSSGCRTNSSSLPWHIFTD